MSDLVNGIRILNIGSIILFLVCCYYMCANSEHSPGALTVVNVDNTEDDDVTVENEDTEVKHDPLNVFYPTKEWKSVKPGQVIPAGLHVRLNLQTGEKEAKLNQDDDGNKYWKAGNKEGMVNTDKKDLTHEELKEALKEFKLTKHDIPDDKRAKEIKDKFKSYNQLKEDFKKMKIGIKTGQEIVTGLYEELKSTNISVEQRSAVLEDLEYHLHQYDNAVLFSDLGGMPLLVKGLNYTDPNLRSLSAFVLGSSVQSNPKVKINAIESGALHQLIRSLATDPSVAVKKKALFALSSMIRDFPYAQKKFFELGGLRSMMQLFEDDKLRSLQVKVVTLMSDLTDEKTHWLAHTGPSEETHKQYQQVPLKDSLFQQGICDVLVPLLENMPDHDSRDKLVVSMLSLYDTCEPVLHKVFSYLQKLETQYLEFTTTEVDLEYIQQIENNINTLLQQLSLKYHKDEL